MAPPTCRVNFCEGDCCPSKPVAEEPPEPFCPSPPWSTLWMKTSLSRGPAPSTDSFGFLIALMATWTSPWPSSPKKRKSYSGYSSMYLTMSLYFFWATSFHTRRWSSRAHVATRLAAPSTKAFIPAISDPGSSVGIDVKYPCCLSLMNLRYIIDSKNPLAAFTPGRADSITSEWSWRWCVGGCWWLALALALAWVTVMWSM
mmetsp:Transcript_7278/g.18698  ORF Transcript_7278/g.18698 Transcript_7278/m.18698 type:complete len:201 (+) Transcript_7278:227-829(+)